MKKLPPSAKATLQTVADVLNGGEAAAEKKTLFCPSYCPSSDGIHAVPCSTVGSIKKSYYFLF